MGGITGLSLSLATFTSSLDDKTLQESFEKTKIYDLRNWSTENIGVSNITKRNRDLRIKGGKYFKQLCHI